MRRAALIWLAVSGCFYTDPINQRPSLGIIQTSQDVVYRGDPVELRASTDDPDGHFVYVHWRVQPCTGEDCDSPFYELSDDETVPAKFVVPYERADKQKVTALRVVLQGQDDFGATAKPDQELWIPIADRAPTLELRKDSRYGYVVSTPINLYAKLGDPDDGPADPTLSWQVYTPTNQPAYDLVDIEVPPDKEPERYAQSGKQFTPKGIGEWEIEVTATDTLGEETTQSIMVTVSADAPPCLSTLSPVIAPTGTALPMSEPTLFQVHVVADDLDPYPAVNDPVLGTTKFAWSLKLNNGARQDLTGTTGDGVTGNRVALDPASYLPGDIIEVRVEIADREAVNRPITCADANPTCSVISDNACLQRQTWRVEVR